MDPISIAIVATTAAVGGTMYSIDQQKKASKQNRAAAEMDRKRMNLQSARDRRDAIKAARSAYGASQTAAANQGALGTSASQGALASIDSQAGSNLSFLDRYGSLTDQASVAIGRANDYNSNAAVGSAVAQLGWSVAGNSNSVAKIWGG